MIVPSFTRNYQNYQKGIQEISIDNRFLNVSLVFENSNKEEKLAQQRSH